MEPSTSSIAASSRSLSASFRSSYPVMLSVLMVSRTSSSATVKVESREKFSTSAVISRLSGSSKSLSQDTRSSRESEFNPRLSCRPGIPNPITMFLLPSEMTLPLSILTLEKVSCGRIIPVIRTNGVYIVSFLPLMSTVVFVLFV